MSDVVCPLKVALQWQLRQVRARIASGKLVSECVQVRAVLQRNDVCRRLRVSDISDPRFHHFLPRNR
jgi:hypothetical protein